MGVAINWLQLDSICHCQRDATGMGFGSWNSAGVASEEVGFRLDLCAEGVKEAWNHAFPVDSEQNLQSKASV